MDITHYRLEMSLHREKSVILIHFDYNTKLIHDLRQRFPSAKWSASKKAWYLPDLPAVREALKLEPKNFVSEKVLKIHPINQKAYLDLSKKIDLKKYSQNTKRMYLAEFMQLLIC